MSSRKKRGGNPNRPSQIARQRAGLTSARDFPAAFEGREEAGVLIESEASAAAAAPPLPPPPLPPVPLAPPTTPPPGASRGNWRLGWFWEEHGESPPETPVREVFTSEVRAVPKRRDQRSRSPLRRSVPEPKDSPKRTVPEPKVGPKRKKVIADFEEIQEEPLVASGPSSGSGLTGSRPVVIRPSKRKAESPKAEAKKKAEEERKKAEAAEAEARRKAEAAEAEAKKKADKEARLEAKRKAEEEEQKKKRKDSNERPLIALDWHNTLSFDGIEGHGVAERSAEILRDLQQRGYDFCVISFASSPETQRAVQQKALQFECELIRPFTSIDIVNRKFRSDPQKRPSICGLITSKAEQVSLRGACAFVDDQSKLLQDVEDLQSRRAEKHRCKCLKSEPYARSSLFKLAAFLHHKQPEEFPLPSLLINICSEALKLFAQGRLKKGG